MDAVSGRSVSFPAKRARVALPCPSANANSTSGVSCGNDCATIVGVAVLRKASNSLRAADFRAATAAFAGGIAFSSSANRGRSSTRGTGKIGGVSWMLPSIADCVVLLKNAESS